MAEASLGNSCYQKFVVGSSDAEYWTNDEKMPRDRLSIDSEKDRMQRYGNIYWIFVKYVHKCIRYCVIIIRY